MVDKLLIYGAGKTAISIAEQIRLSPALSKQYHVIGFLDDDKAKVHDYPYAPVLGTLADAKRLKEDGISNVLFGFVLPTRSRLERASQLEEMGYRFPSFYDKVFDDTWGIYIGKGVLVHPTANLSPGIQIQDFAAVNAGCCLEDCLIGRGVILTPNVVIGTGASIGEGTIIYPNSVIAPGVSIGAYSVVSATELVTKKLPDNSFYKDGIIREARPPL